MSAYRDWHVSMKVVCVKRSGWVHFSGPNAKVTHPKCDEICTIAAFDFFKGEVFISLEEYGSKIFYDATKFRPVQKRTTDISIFTALLNPTEDEIAEAEMEDNVCEFLTEHGLWTK